MNDYSYLEVADNSWILEGRRHYLAIKAIVTEKLTKKEY